MVDIQTAGEVVSLGDFSGGYPTQTSWGNRIPSPDPGQSLATYSPLPTDPLTIWRTQPSVRKVVDFAARNIASVPWHAYLRASDTDRRRFADSPAEQLLRKPAPFLTGFRLWKSVATDAMLYDAWCVLYAGGRLIRLSPRLLDVRVDFLGQVVEIWLKSPSGGDSVDLTDAPLAYGAGWSPVGGIGVPPMVTLAAILNENRRAVEWRTAQWENGPKVSGVLTRPAANKPWDEKKRERFTQTWGEWKAAKAGGTPILEDGMTYDQLDGIKPVDAQDIEGRRLTDIEVTSAFHIAPELVGARAGNFSNIAAFRQMLFGPALGPMLEELQQTVQAFLVPYLDTTPGLYVELDREAAMNGSFSEQAQIMSTSTGGPWLTRNEARAKQNLSAIEGGDELITPLNVVIGGMASPFDTGSQNLGTDPNSNKGQAMPQISTQGLVKAISAEVINGLQRQKAATPGKPSGLGTPAKRRAALAESIKATLDQQAESLSDDMDPDDLDEAEFKADWDPIMSAAVKGHLTKSALAGAWAVLSAHNPEAEDWSAEVMDGYLSKMADTTASGINSGVVAAATVALAAAGSSLAEAFSALKNDQAESWAASSSSQAQAFGGSDAAAASGVRTKTWTVTSSNPRPSHAEMDGETVSIDEVFSNGARWPGDISLDADESAGCTCLIDYGSED